MRFRGMGQCAGGDAQRNDTQAGEGDFFHGRLRYHKICGKITSAAAEAL
jgi:hypothetical protein